MLEKIINSPHVNLVSGLILLYTSGYQTWTTLDDQTVGAHHGILVFSLITLAKSIIGIMKGMKQVGDAGGQFRGTHTA